MPKVSIITRTKDRPLLLERAIESVLSQSFSDWEHIIVNNNIIKDSSFDELIARYEKQYSNRLKVITNRTGIDFDPSISVGIENADGEYVVVHDDDDSWKEDFLSKTVGFLEQNPDFGAVETYLNYFIEEVCEDGIKIHQSYPYTGLSQINIKEIFSSKIYPATISTLCRKKCIDEIGKFNLELLKYGDREFFLRFLKKYKMANLPEYLANCHARPYGQQAYANSTLSNYASQDNSYWEKKVMFELFKHNFDLWLYYHWIEILRPYAEKKAVKIALKKCEGQKIALYGAGIRAEELLKNHKKEFEKLNIVAVFDQNVQKQGSDFAGVVILPPEKIAEIKPEKVLMTVANVSMVKGFIDKLITENKLDCEVVTLN